MAIKLVVAVVTGLGTIGGGLIGGCYYRCNYLKNKKVAESNSSKTNEDTPNLKISVSKSPSQKN